MNSSVKTGWFSVFQNASTKIMCPVLLMGSHSVIPSTMPRTMILSHSSNCIGQPLFVSVYDSHVQYSTFLFQCQKCQKKCLEWLETPENYAVSGFLLSKTRHRSYQPPILKCAKHILMALSYPHFLGKSLLFWKFPSNLPLFLHSPETSVILIKSILRSFGFSAER